MPSRAVRQIVASLAVLSAVIVVAQEKTPPDAYARAHYTKYEYEIPMRDGVKLFTSVYVPKDVSRQWPILLERTPYSVRPYGIDNYRSSLGPSDLFMKDGFIFAYQDVRGRYMSEGEWMEIRPHRTGDGPRETDESTDAYDTIDWLVKHVAGNSGKVGMWGISYPGFYVDAALIDAHPALVAASPQAPVTDYYLGDDAFHNGAFLLAHNFSFYVNFKPRQGGPARPGDHDGVGHGFDYGTSDGYEFYLRMGPLGNSNTKYLKGENPYWTLNLDHTSYDAFWKARSVWRHFTHVTPAVLTVGGWFDAEDLQGALRTYATVEQNNPGITNALVMGPWTHGGWARGPGDRVGHVRFGASTGEWFREHVEFPFFQAHLKGLAGETVAEATVFETGRNVWHRLDTWPPAGAARKTLYLQAGGALAWTAPDAHEGFDQYVSDPSRPVPLVGYVTRNMPRDYMTADQRFAATRPDVLVYETPPLEQDVTAAGSVEATIYVSTTGTDSDFVVKLIDVYPADYPSPERDDPGAVGDPVPMANYQQLVRGEPFRGKFRNGFDKPEPFTPGEPARIQYAMPDVYHTFRRGHRIMVQIQSSWLPFIDRNPQKFMDIPKATDADFVAATERVYRSAKMASGVSLNVLP
jgi:uncharacterized protein